MTLGLKDRFSIVKGLLYLILGICCIYLIVTGRYLNYIAPRYELLLGISGVALIFRRSSDDHLGAVKILQA